MSSELLTAVLTGWDRHNEVLVNLLLAIPPDALGARVMENSPTVASMFSHMHHERLCSVLENVPEIRPIPVMGRSEQPSRVGSKIR